MRRRIAMVTPWFGEDCKGGAETQALELAGRLAAHDDVTILTTTSRSFLHDWDTDYHAPGDTRAGNYSVKRFRVRPRDRELFHRLNEELLSTPRERWSEITAKRTKFAPYIDESINAPDLEEHLERRAPALYDSVLFLPYLYGVVVRGIEKYDGGAHLIPCLHDEAYARIPRIEDAIHKAKSLLFNSSGEAQLALRLYGPGVLAKSHVVGEGIAASDAATVTAPVPQPYFLYIGRREPEKGIDVLLEVFRNRGASLVLVGPGTRSYDEPQQGIYDLGFVDEATKIALLKGAVALLNPSTNESYSRVLMEAWREGIPVVAHGACLATATAVREADAGFVAGPTSEWIATVEHIKSLDAESRRAIGERGAEYAAQHSDWNAAVGRLRAAIGLELPALPKRRGKRIDQVLEGFDDGDAISDNARSISRRLRALGYESDIYAQNLPLGIEDARRLESRSLSGTDAIIYHHSIGSGAADAVLKTTVPKAMVYHNITPSRFFAPYAPNVAEQLQRGREQLGRLVESFDMLIADSDYNAAELHDLGARNVRTIPVVTNFARLDRSPQPRTLNVHRGTTWLFVGRVSPNKGIRALIDAFEAYLALDDDANLVILGKYDRGDRYYNELKALLHERRIDPFVTFTGFVSESDIVGRYRSADVFVCLSEHEGFCVPIVEAMYFDVPIVAKALTAVPGTLGGAGLLLEADADACTVAAAVHEVCTNASLRNWIIDTQRERRRTFLPELIEPLIDAMASDLIATRA